MGNKNIIKQWKEIIKKLSKDGYNAHSIYRHLRDEGMNQDDARRLIMHTALPENLKKTLILRWILIAWGILNILVFDILVFDDYISNIPFWLHIWTIILILFRTSIWYYLYLMCWIGSIFLIPMVFIFPYGIIFAIVMIGLNIWLPYKILHRLFPYDGYKNMAQDSHTGEYIFLDVI